MFAAGPTALIVLVGLLLLAAGIAIIAAQRPGSAAREREVDAGRQVCGNGDCRAPNRLDARFCAQCGKPLTETQDAERARKQS